MVIHKKKKVRFHVKDVTKVKQKRGKFSVIKRTPKAVRIKQIGRKNREQPVKKKNLSFDKEKNNFSEKEIVKENGNKTEQKEKETIKPTSKLEETNQKDTIKKKEMLSVIGSAGTAIALEQIDGGNEVYESYMTAKAMVNPVENMADVGKRMYQSQVVKKKEKQRRKGTSAQPKRKQTVVNHTEKENKYTVNSASDRYRKIEKENMKFEKRKGKSKRKEQETEASRRGYKTVSKQFGRIEKEKKKKTSAYREMQSVNRNRKLQFFLDKLNAEEKQKESFSKLAKDLFLNRVMFEVNKAAPMIGLVCLGLMFLVTLTAVPVMAVITVIYNSPFAVFFPSISSGDMTQQVLSAYMSEFYEEINSEMENLSGYDVSQKFYVDYDGAAVPDNYYDVLAVYMVEYGNGDTATDMSEEAEKNLKAVFEDMCSYYITDRTEIERDEETDEVSYTYVKEVHIKLKWYSDMILEYGFNTEEQEILAELMKPEYLTVLRQTVDGDRGETISPEQYQAVVDAVSDENGKKVVSYVLSKVGYPYSQAYRDSGSYYDCSSLAYYAWQSAGVNIMYEGANTAAAEGKFCYDHHYLVNYEEMQAGDLIFYSYEENGRFFDITHVAVYVGDGKVVEAANERIGVVYRPVQSKGSIVFIGRPR